MNRGAAGLPPAASSAGIDRARADLQALLDRLVEARRRGSDDEYRQLAEGVPSIVWVADPDGRARYLNSGWYEFTGLDATRSIGYGWNDVIHRDDLDTAFSRWTHAINTGEPLEVIYRFRRRDAAYRWHIGGARLQRTADGRAIEWIGVCLDVDDFVADDDIARQLISRGGSSTAAGGTDNGVQT